MGKRTSSKRTQKPLPPPRPTGEDATPQRLVQDPHDLEKGIIDRAGERAPLVRRFRASHLDRLHKAGAIDHAQWFAGNWYREQYNRGAFGVRVVAAYGERTGAAEHPGAFGYGLPRQEAQVRARDMWRKAREQWAKSEQGFMDRLLIRDDLPRYTGRAFMRSMAQIRRNLDKLAEYLRVC